MVPRKTWFSENVGPISKLGSVRDGSRNLVFGWFCVSEARGLGLEFLTSAWQSRKVSNLAIYTPVLCLSK